jgi:hypothetical protein
MKHSGVGYKDWRECYMCAWKTKYYISQVAYVIAHKSRCKEVRGNNEHSKK